MVTNKISQPGFTGYRVEEQTLVSKTANAAECEDFVHISRNFVAVIDGATTKSGRIWSGETSGKRCAHLINQTIFQLPPDISARQAVNAFTKTIMDFYRAHQVEDLMRRNPEERATASLVVFSLVRKEVWFVGDCQCMMDRKLITNKKRIDDITAQARSAFIAAELARGRTVEELLKKDSGREFIFPLLQNQMFFQNSPDTGEFWYPTINGFPVPDAGIHIEPVPASTKTIVLASDGFPVLKDTLAESENELARILRDDPLLYRIFKSTKGFTANQQSFDDRSFIKIGLHPANST